MGARRGDAALMRDPFPKHKTIAILGYGASGRAAARLLHRLGKRLIISDAGSLEADAQLDAQWHPGTNEVGAARAAVLSPGLNPQWPENRSRPALKPIWERWEKGELTLVAEVDLAARTLACPWVAVGGTDGKSTTAGWTNRLFSDAGRAVVLGGNSWRALSEVAMEADSAEVAIVEVSAFQMLRGHELRPRVIVMTNIARDHLDHYASYEDYVAAKKEIIAHAAEETTFVYNRDDEELSRWAGELQLRGVRCVSFGTSSASEGRGAELRDGALVFTRAAGACTTLGRARIALPGAHNARNFMAAALAFDAVFPETSDSDFLAALERAAAYPGLPHRVEFLRERRGVRWFNDSKATNVHAACVGISAMSQGACVIVGGVEKRLDLEPLISLLAEKDATVIAIGELRDRLKCEAAERVRSLLCADSLEEAIALADAHAKAGAEVLLAPASASFDMFRSFEHRGDCFREAVMALED